MPSSEAGPPKRRQTVRRKDERLLRNQISRYNQLFQIGQLITSEMDFDNLFKVIVEQTNQIMDSERSSVFLVDEKGFNLAAFVSTDLKKNEINLPRSSGVAGWVFSNKTPLIVPDAYSEPRFYPGIDEKTGFKTKNILCVPLINRDYKCIGTLQALNKKSGDFTTDDKEILMHLANYITVAIENSKLYALMKASDSAKQKVISHLSHELRTPLAIISSIFKLIERKAKESNDRELKNTIARGKRNVTRLMELHEKVDDIIRERPIEEKTRMLGVIDDVVGLAEELDDQTTGQYAEAIKWIKRRIESIFKVEETRIENIDLQSFLIEILARQLPANQRNYPEIITRIEKGLSVAMDKEVLRKTFIALLKNAVENTPEGGQIKISALSTKSNIYVDFQDCGVGITQEHRKNIFGGFLPAQSTEFYSSKKPYEFNAGGAGLDLLRLKMFAEQFGFTVDFESTRCKYIPLATDQCPGKISECPHIKDRSECLSSGGTIFTITFPRH
jgi:signal transduction histidine kinase